VWRSEADSKRGGRGGHRDDASAPRHETTPAAAAATARRLVNAAREAARISVAGRIKTGSADHLYQLWSCLLHALFGSSSRDFVTSNLTVN